MPVVALAGIVANDAETKIEAISNFDFFMRYIPNVLINVERCSGSKCVLKSTFWEHYATGQECRNWY